MKTIALASCLVCGFAGLAAAAPPSNAQHLSLPSLALRLPKGSTVLIYRTGFGIIEAHGITAVSEPTVGDFCVTLNKPAAVGALPVVGVEWGYSYGFALEAYFEKGAYDCSPGDVEIRTYDFNSGGYPVASDNVAFTLYIPATT